MRVSDYNIYVPLEESEYIIAQGYTGAVDIVPKHIASSIHANRISELSTKWQNHLKSRGYITTYSFEEEIDFAKEIAKTIHKGQIDNRKGFLLLVTYDCNLRCAYCYEKCLLQQDTKWRSVVMCEETAFKAFKAMDNLSKKIEGPKQIMLYGGEPLMSRTLKTVEHVLKLGLSKGYRFSAVTNAVELDNFAHLLGPGQIESIQVTLDGPRFLHDLKRKGVNGEPTYDRIMSAISLALSKQVSVSVRINLDRNNIECLDELSDDLKAHGFFDNSSFRAYCRALYSEEKKDESLLRERDVADFYKRNKVCSKRVNRLIFGLHIQERVTSLLRNNRLPLLSPVYCGSNYGMYILDPHGKIYPCWDTVGRADLSIGSFMPKLVINEKILQEWHKRTTYQMPKCHKCPYMLICGGGCAWQAKCKSNWDNGFCDDFAKLFAIYAPIAIANHNKFQNNKSKGTDAG